MDLPTEHPLSYRSAPCLLGCSHPTTTRDYSTSVICQLEPSSKLRTTLRHVSRSLKVRRPPGRPPDISFFVICERKQTCSSLLLIFHTFHICPCPRISLVDVLKSVISVYFNYQ